jgi:tetratricopeptide (TPR) repeat protein
MAEQPLSALDPGLRRQVEHARSALDRGNLDYAIDLFRDVLRREPACLSVRRVLRSAQMKRATLNLGLKRVIRLTCHVPMLAWAQLLMRRSPVQAMDRAERVLDWNPRYHRALTLLASAASAHGIPETAIFALESACESRPNDHVSACSLVRAYLEENRPQEALVIAEKWGRLRPTDDAVRDLLKEALVTQSLRKGGWESDTGTYRDKLRDEKEAIELERRSRSRTPVEAAEGIIAAARREIEREPESLNHHMTIVRAYQDIGDFDRALEWLDRARKLRAGVSDPGLARRVVELKVDRLKAEFARTGEDDRGISELRIAEFQNLVSEFPNEAPFHLELAENLRPVGRLDEAIVHYQAAQRSSKLRAQATYGLGACFQGKGLNDLAVEQFLAAKRELVVMDELKKQVVYALGSCLETMGRNEEATAEFKQIYSTDIGYRDVAAKIEELYRAE